MVCSPNRCIPVFTPAEMGSRSMEWGARKAPTLSGTLKAPSGLHVRAAMKAGNLASATPTRGFRCAGTAFSRAETTPASPRYSPSRPSNSHVGGAKVGSFNPVADTLKRSEDLIEDLLVIRLVGVQHDGVRVSGHGLFERHPNSHAGCRREPVDDQGPRGR